MINLLIADDEPLVQAGIKSMINWDELGINLVGTATNGSIAYNMIKEHAPEIVITDIKMPVMTGLELARKCFEEKMTLPVFIILTSYEDFHFAKEALTYQVLDYLIKLELTPETLTSTLQRAIERVQELQQSTQTQDVSLDSVSLIKEQFYTRLVMNLFESENQFLSQASNLGLSFDFDSYAACYLEIQSSQPNTLNANQQLSLYSSCLQIASEITPKYLPCHVLSLDTRHFIILFFLDSDNTANYKKVLNNTIRQVSQMLFNYYSVIIRASIGSLVHAPMQIASSFQDAKQIFAQLTTEEPIIFAEDVTDSENLKNVFNISLFKEDIRKAYAEYDEKALYDIFTSIIELFADKPTHSVQAMDAAGNILYLSLSLLTSGEQIVSDIFSEKTNGYRSLYELTTVEQIMEWLTFLRDGLCASFATHNKDYKNHIVTNVKKYINEHIEEKLTLNKVAEVYNISPNYLSILFSKHNDIGFTDYINHSKIQAAIDMLQKGDLKVYEISDILGFESAFYFSRVFKKVTGMSPRDYMNSHPLE